jgi:uncharacterized protein (DUF1697 family)
VAGAKTYAILLRAIGPVTHKLMSMEAWRAAAAKAGLEAPETALATGNMIASFAGSATEATKAMTEVLRGFGLKDNVIPVLREPALLERLIASGIMTGAEERPRETAIYFFIERRPDLEWAKTYEGRERLAVVEDHLLVDFDGDTANSGVLLRRIEKTCGTSTARNLNTVRSLVRLAANRGKTA